MIWLVWRRQRAALLLAAGLFAAAVVVLIVARLVIEARAAQLGASACLTNRDLACSEGPTRELYFDFQGVYRMLQLGTWVLPPALGLVVGSGLFAREFEQHTDVLALTQAVSRRRWWATGVATMLVPLLTATLLLPLVTGWALDPYSVLYNSFRMVAPHFDISGVGPAAEALTAFAVTVGAGLLLRESLMTVVVSVLGGIALLVLSVSVRYDLLPDQVVTAPLDVNGNAVSSIPDGAVPRDYGYVDAAGTHIEPGVAPRSCPYEDYGTCLPRLGIVGQFETYQPDTYYWPLQAIFAGTAVAIALLLMGAGLWRLYRR